MRDYVLSIVVALLLSAPMLWRLEGEVDRGAVEAPVARVIFHDNLPTGAAAEPLPSIQGAGNEIRFGFTSIVTENQQRIDDGFRQANLLQAEVED
jgi:hypothetical protein